MCRIRGLAAKTKLLATITDGFSGLGKGITVGTSVKCSGRRSSDLGVPHCPSVPVVCNYGADSINEELPKSSVVYSDA